MLKHCPFCHRDLELDHFVPDARYADGHSPRCNDCSDGQRPQQAPEPCLTDVLPGRQPPENPWIEAKRRLWALRQGQDPSRRRAWKAVERALRSGTLTRQPCQVGGPRCQKWPVQAHHLSYEQGLELEVVWACKRCHDGLTEPALVDSNASRRRS